MIGFTTKPLCMKKLYYLNNDPVTHPWWEGGEKTPKEQPRPQSAEEEQKQADKEDISYIKRKWIHNSYTGKGK